MGQTLRTRHTAEALSVDAYNSDVYWQSKFTSSKCKYWKLNTVPLAISSSVYEPGDVEATMDYVRNRVDLFNSKNGLHVASVCAVSGEVMLDQINGLEVTWD